MAGAFTAIGLVAALVVGLKEQEEEIAEAVAEKTDTAAVATDAAAQAAVQMPIALLGTLLSSPAGPVSVAGLARMVGRNLPLVALLALIALMFWPNETDKRRGRSRRSCHRQRRPAEGPPERCPSIRHGRVRTRSGLKARASARSARVGLLRCSQAQILARHTARARQGRSQHGTAAQRMRWFRKDLITVGRALEWRGSREGIPLNCPDFLGGCFV